MKTCHTYSWEDLVNVPHIYTGSDTRLNLINMLEQSEQCVMELVRAQAVITLNIIYYVAGKVETEAVMDIDPENM